MRKLTLYGLLLATLILGAITPVGSIRQSVVAAPQDSVPYLVKDITPGS